LDDPRSVHKRRRPARRPYFTPFVCQNKRKRASLEWPTQKCGDGESIAHGHQEAAVPPLLLAQV